MDKFTGISLATEISMASEIPMNLSTILDSYLHAGDPKGYVLKQSRKALQVACHCVKAYY